MIIDLAVLALTGLIFEVIVMYIFLEMFGANVVPFYIISLLVCIIAVGRWNWKGLAIVPVMSLISVLSGFILRKATGTDGASIYNWKMFISVALSLASTALIIPLKQKSKSFKENNDGSITIAFIALVMLVAFIVEVLSYSIIVAENPIEYIGTLAVVNIPCWFFTLIVMFVLRKQGIIVDAKKNLISKRKEQELEQQYYSHYRNEILEKPNEEEDSSK
ncbi:MAG: hypothetical protein K6G48_05565 [Acholeplasmatales bacterium]|nr:hypothetical protein [Acholeplasmatales bacterium]